MHLSPVPRAVEVAIMGVFTHHRNQQKLQNRDPSPTQSQLLTTRGLNIGWGLGKSSGRTQQKPRLWAMVQGWVRGTWAWDPRNQNGRCSGDWLGSMKPSQEGVCTLGSLPVGAGEGTSSWSIFRCQPLISQGPLRRQKSHQLLKQNLISRVIS